MEKEDLFMNSADLLKDYAGKTEKLIQHNTILEIRRLLDKCTDLEDAKSRLDELLDSSNLMNL